MGLQGIPSGLGIYDLGQRLNLLLLLGWSDYRIFVLQVRLIDGLVLSLLGLKGITRVIINHRLLELEFRTVESARIVQAIILLFWLRRFPLRLPLVVGYEGDVLREIEPVVHHVLGQRVHLAVLVDWVRHIHLRQAHRLPQLHLMQLDLLCEFGVFYRLLLLDLLFQLDDAAQIQHKLLHLVVVVGV